MLKRNIVLLLKAKPAYQNVARFAKISPQAMRNEFQVKKMKEISQILQSKLSEKSALSVADWKSFAMETNNNRLGQQKPEQYLILRALKNLKHPCDFVQNAYNFFEAFDIKPDLALKRIIVDLYAKKASQRPLTNEEEQSVIQMYVRKLTSFLIYLFNTFLINQNRFFLAATNLLTKSCIFCPK